MLPSAGIKGTWSLAQTRSLLVMTDAEALDLVPRTPQGLVSGAALGSTKRQSHFMSCNNQGQEGPQDWLLEVNDSFMLDRCNQLTSMAALVCLHVD